MKALLMSAPGHVAVTDVELPELGPNQVLIKIKMSGICTNDVRDYLGDCDYSYPRIGGHEYCGVIEQLGSNVNAKRFHPGQNVVTYIIEDCKECYFCKTDHANICEEHPRSRVFHCDDGISGYCGFAEYVIADAEDLIVYEHETSYEKMAFTEPVACVINSIERVDIRFGQDVLVIGGGTMGLLHVMLLRARGAHVIVSEPMAERRELALELGASVAFDPTENDPIEMVQGLTEGRGADAVFNTCAHPAIANQAVQMTAACGTCVMFSSIHPHEDVPIDAGALHSFQKTVTGAVSPTVRSYFEAVQMIDKNLLDPTPLIQGVFDYTDFQSAMDTAIRPDTYKVLVRFGD